MIVGENDLVNPFLDQIRSKAENLNLWQDSTDDRINKLISISNSVCCIVLVDELHKLPEDIKEKPQNYLLLTKKIQDQLHYPLNEDEALYNEPSFKAGSATGFLIGDDLIATAHHVVKGKSVRELTQLRFLFGYKNTDPVNWTDITLPREDVYQLDLEYLELRSGIVAHGQGGSYKDDWCILKLDRVPTNSTPLTLKDNAQSKLSDPIIMIGHPTGLPQKISLKGEIAKVIDGGFLSSLDSFKGNSGSPVFCSETLDVIGILIDGIGDFSQVTDQAGNTTMTHMILAENNEFDVCDYPQFISIQPTLESLENQSLSQQNTYQ